ncbi:MAG: YetF domain-containing protein [Brevundimonas sp.]
METLHAFIGTEGQDIGALQMAVRAVLIFVLGVLIVRFAATRAFGKWSALDIILAVIVGSNLSRALTGSAPFLPTVIATVLLVVLHGLLAMAAARWSWLSTLTKGSSITLVRDGRIDEAAMRRSGIGKGDLRMALRAAGHNDLKSIKSASLERNGDISVIDE